MSGKRMGPLATALCLSIAFIRPAMCEVGTDRGRLEELRRVFEEELEAGRDNRYFDLLQSEAEPQHSINRNPDVEMIRFDRLGHPVFYGIENANAAKTISTDDVYPGGGFGFALTGSGTSVGELGIWDAGGVRASHQEFGGRVTQIDSPGATHYHATHVSGTMIAAGVVAGAKGMSYQANLAAYDWNSDNAEMATAAANGMKVSNHSYGYITGWGYDYNNNYWIWWGDLSVSATEDYRFGYYSQAARDWDLIAASAPYYTIVKSSGNDHAEGPSAGTWHWHWDNVGGQWAWANDFHEVDGGTDGFDCISEQGNAKNIITVGAVHDIYTGWTQPSDVSILPFSSLGMTDDGRIKPDLVANGSGLYSALDNHDAAYGSLDGTSMATPNLSGSLNLLVEHYETTHSNATPRAATMKAVLIQTADEAGSNAGPDYVHGWGLMNTRKAAQLIADDANLPGLIREESLADGATDEFTINLTSTTDLRVTIAWTDPAGTVPPAVLNPTNQILVNDLDVRIAYVANGTTYRPYILDPLNPANAATTGDNARDNVEQVFIANASAGEYRVTVTHKGSIPAGQAYSITATSELTDALQVDSADHNVGNVIATMTDQGILGFMDATQSDGSGFVFPANGGNQLYIGGLWVAQGANYIANRDYDADPQREWVVSSSPDGHVVVDSSGQSDQDIHSGYTDDGAANPYEFYVRQESWAFSASSEDDFVIVRYFIHNQADTAQTGIRAGLFLDLDLGDDYTDDEGGTDEGRHMAYMSDGSGIHVGARILRGDLVTDAVANVTLIDNETFVWPNSYISDADKLAFIAGSDSAHVLKSTPAPNDYSLLVSVGPFSLAPGDSNEVVFAVVGGTSYSDLLANSDRAQVAYLPTVDTPDPTMLVSQGARLLPNTPNPFNPKTTVRFELPKPGRVEIGLYDAQGRRIRSLASGAHEAGRHHFIWDGRDEQGRPVSGGVYFLRLTDGASVDSRRIVLLK